MPKMQLSKSSLEPIQHTKDPSVIRPSRAPSTMCGESDFWICLTFSSCSFVIDL